MPISLLKNDFTSKTPKGPPPKRWSDLVRKETVLPLLTAEEERKIESVENNLKCDYIIVDHGRPVSQPTEDSKTIADDAQS